MKKLSTTHNLLSLNNYIQTSFDNNMDVDIVFFDFKKAFDNVNHHCLLQKLIHYGLHQSYVNLLCNYLYDHSQFTLCNNFSSMLLPCSSGVPQGSLIGPLLFMVFINDLPSMLTCESLLYADNLKIFSKISKSNYDEDVKHIQSNINNVLHWSSNCHLPINVQKCNFVRFSKKTRLVSSTHMTVKYTLGDTDINQVDSYNDLGVTLDKELSFNLHYNKIYGKALCCIFLLNRCFHRCDQIIKIRLYKGYILPILDYACQVWNPQH